MNLSMKWLSDYVDIDVKPRDYAHALTMSGSKVEGYEIEGEEITNVVVGKVLEITPHPDADKLVVCKIDVAKDEPLQIVTGAKNVVVGALVPVALDGSTLPHGVKIKKGKLRGVVSEGMLCSVAELNVTVHDFPYAIEDGIFLIEEDCKPGDDIHDAIGINDTCVEFEITSNRPDCLSVIGLARETAATYGVPLKLNAPVVKGSGDDIKNYISVEVKNAELCPRYIAKAVKNVKIEPSPRWMRERLRASGVRPINNLVDITNYVMLEYGQPLHAFDASFIDGKKIIVRNAMKDEKMQTLDGIDRVLNENMLVIADENKPLAVAGVMGGENSSIIDTTKTVIFESANFLGSSVRITSKNLALRTDSSGRFEKGLDPHNTLPAIMRACELVEMLGAGEVVDGIIDVDNSPKEPVKIKLECDWINNFLGIDLAHDEMIAMLHKLGFEVKNEMIIVPSFRTDVFHKADVAEEVARIYGYDKIPTTAVRGVARGKLTEEQKFERKIHKALQASGCYEVSTYSFISPKYYDKINLPADSSLRNCVTITNPLGEDTSVMRTTTLPSMLEVLSRNYNNRNAQFYGYEIGSEYIPTKDGELPNENPQVTIGMYGNCDFYQLKGIVETMLERLAVKDWDIHPIKDDPSFHPGRTALITKGDVVIGILGEVHPQVLVNYNIGTKAYLAKFDVNAMFSLANTETQYKPLPKYPASTRDLSLICDDELPIVEIEKAIKGAVGNTLEAVKLFDVYKGAQIAENKKSVSYSIIMRSPTQTLTDTEADAAIKRVLKALDKINVTLRA
ncbi:phenylalanine--tRNA ligase subunit beta [Paludicola sp. MB14-C6]|uniref:phenylalanine--tRNA ligase subunit beta n=1 Tax=Paludihabitans sp. MB14-C6 TaxID=3070656 RepID=UPI0027DC2658|nr:phenylalanine--tRNA ligase subunit beta [Paludicola sp. MB14-C6]WMJ24072.1 phenylalanine--tRNA ligase subunit beta [Paludicola sp. MB14-C6]